MKSQKTILLPVIYTDEHIDMAKWPAIDQMHKLKYNEKKSAFVNFWSNLMKSFDINDLTEDEMKMDFQGSSTGLQPTSTHTVPNGRQMTSHHSSSETLATVSTTVTMIDSTIDDSTQSDAETRSISMGDIP